MMQRPPTDLVERLPEQFFARIVGQALAEAAKPGERFIDLGRGNPDLPPPPHAVEAARAAMLEVDTPAIHGYAPFRGHPYLKEAIAERYRLDHGVELDPATEVAVVPGSKVGIMYVAQAAAEAGTTMLVPDPGYPDYPSGVALAGAVGRPLVLREDDGWQPDFATAAALEDDISLVLLNYPSNPCAVCERPGTFEAAVEFARSRGAWLMHDLAYGFLAFDGRRARSVLEVPGAKDVAVELWSASKVYGMAGWRIGFVVGNAELVRRVEILVDHTTAGIFGALQRGLHAALTGDQSHVHARAAIYAQRRDLLVSILGPEVLTPPEGSFYAWLKLPPGLDTRTLMREARISIAPGTGFGARGEGYARLSLALPSGELEEAACRLARAISTYAGT